MRVEHDLHVWDEFVGGVDNLLKEVRHVWIADHAAPDEHAITGLSLQLMLEIVEPLFRRAVDEFVEEAVGYHFLSQVGQPLCEFGAVVHGD